MPDRRFLQQHTFWYFRIAIFMLLISAHTMYGSDGIVSGIIEDSQTKLPLSGAAVRIEGTVLGGSTNRDGKFVINSIPVGRYILLSSFTGYTITKTEFAIVDQDSIFLKIELMPTALQTSEVIVSANKRMQAIQDVPVSVVVVDQRAIQQRNITKVDDLMRYIPGVTVSRDHIGIRGASGFGLGIGSRTLMLLDGFPMLTGDGGATKFDAIPLFDVERIEVVKGAASALYGNGAIGGVISFITREPKDYPEVRFRSYQGLYTVPRFTDWRHTQQLSQTNGFDASYSQKIGPVGWIFSGGVKGDDSYRAYDDSFRWNVFSKVSFAPAPSTNVTIFGTNAYEDHTNWMYWRDFKNATQPPVNTNKDERIRSTKTALAGEFKQIISDAHFFTFRLGSYRTRISSNLDRVNTEYIESSAWANNVEVQINSRLNEKVLFTYGGNFVRNDVRSNQYGTKGQYSTGGFLQTEFTNLDGIIVVVGSRLDYEKTFGEKVNVQLSPKFGMSYDSPLDVQLRLHAGRGFRVPNVNERNGALQFQGFTALPNLGLTPEKCWSFELGANQDVTLLDIPLTYDVAIFQTELYSLIEPKFVVSDNTPVVQLENTTRARIQGIELGVKGWILKDIIGSESSVMAMYPKDISLDEVLKYRSTVQWQSHILVPAGPVEFHLDYRFQSRVENIDNRFILLNIPRNADTRVSTHVLDVRTVLNFDKLNSIPITLALNAKNLLDYYYTDVIGNLAPTRSISLQVDAKF